MAQHLLIVDIAAPLLVLGLRSPVYAFMLPPSLLAPLARWHALRAALALPAQAARRGHDLRSDDVALAPRARLRGRAALAAAARESSTSASCSPA